MSACKFCGAALRFERTESGQVLPVNAATGRPHWRCPGAEEHRQRQLAARPEPSQPDLFAPRATRLCPTCTRIVELAERHGLSAQTERWRLCEACRPLVQEAA